jgi:hypothetical protein
MRVLGSGYRFQDDTMNRRGKMHNGVHQYNSGRQAQPSVFAQAHQKASSAICERRNTPFAAPML